jgi:hypothetical protein
MESRPTVFERMKKRWGVGPWGVFAILLTFALTGLTVVWIRPLILNAILPADAPRWAGWVTYALVIFPLYQVILLAYGAVLGQFSFFWQKEKTAGRWLVRTFAIRSRVKTDS